MLLFRYKYPGFLLFACLSFLINCTPARVLPKNYKGEQLHFGQGGGFSGIITHYALLDNGLLFQKEYRDTNFIAAASWEKGFVKQMFQNYHQLERDKLDHYHPGNLYYFIEYHKTGEPVHRISWGESGYTPGDHIISFYNLLYRSTKSKS